MFNQPISIDSRVYQFRLVLVKLPMPMEFSSRFGKGRHAIEGNGGEKIEQNSISALDRLLHRHATVYKFNQVHHNKL